MRALRRTAALYSFGILIALTATRASALEPATASTTVRIGMPATMFRDVKPAVFAALARPFHSLVETQTGLKCDLILVQTPDEMREQLESGKLQFGVFNGFEFAWMRQKSSNLQALMIAPPQHRPLKALVVVNQDSPVKSLADLKGKTVALPQGTREYARLFLTRQCQALGQSPDAYFGQVTTPVMPDTAMHEVVDAKVQAAIVDGSMFQSYTDRFSGRAKRLRVLTASESFPESVVVYRRNLLDEDTVRRFHEGMSTAHTTVMGRQLLSLWSMAGFQPIPADYENHLAESLKNFPPPK
jgi:ABC-type phosphate/phosphonate transport system substrate-binding protein